MNTQISVLVVEDEENWREKTFRELLEDEGYLVETAASHEEAIAKLHKQHFDLAIVDINLTDIPHNVDGTLVLDAIAELGLKMEIMIVSGTASSDKVVEKYQPSGFFRKQTFDDHQFILTVKKVLKESIAANA